MTPRTHRGRPTGRPLASTEWSRSAGLLGLFDRCAARRALAGLSCRLDLRHLDRLGRRFAIRLRVGTRPAGRSGPTPRRTRPLREHDRPPLWRAWRRRGPCPPARRASRVPAFGAVRIAAIAPATAPISRPAKKAPQWRCSRRLRIPSRTAASSISSRATGTAAPAVPSAAVRLLHSRRRLGCISLRQVRPPHRSASRPTWAA